MRERKGISRRGVIKGGLFYDDYVGSGQLTSATVFRIAAAENMTAKKKARGDL